MPIGVQLANLNKYRRYPFADDADLSCTITLTGNSAASANLDFFAGVLRAFRFVHVGNIPVASVKFLGVDYANDTPARVYTFKFGAFDINGVAIPLMCKGLQVSDTSLLSFNVRSGSGLHDVLYTLHDFDVANCISVYFKCDTTLIYDMVESTGLDTTSHFNSSCNIEMSHGTVLSMKMPHVSSLLDDNGSPIRGQGAVELVAGYNTKLDVMPESNTVVISALKGGGAGYPVGKSGLSTAFMQSVLKSINGISASPDGNINITGGRGIVVNPIENTNIINIYSDLESGSSAECKLK